MNKTSLDELTDDLINTLNLWDKNLGTNKDRNNLEARETWCKYYREARLYYGASDSCSPHVKSYEVANRKLRQMYDLKLSGSD